MIFYTSLTALSSFVYIDEPVTFLLYDLFNILFIKGCGYTTNFRIFGKCHQLYPSLLRIFVSLIIMYGPKFLFVIC